MIHIMLDLETWGKRPGCDIRSIGACVFDPVAGTVVMPSGAWESDPGNNVFYTATDNEGLPENKRHPGYSPNQTHIYFDKVSKLYRRWNLTHDPETVQWWNDQSAEAQAAFADPVDLRDACEQFTDWMIGLISKDRHSIAKADFLDGKLDLSNIRLWANDPQFDVSILEAIYHAVNLPVPWHYRAPRSLRTITEAAGMTRDDFAAFNFGTAHNALDDAIAQAGIVCEAYKRLGLSAVKRPFYIEQPQENK